MTPRQTRKYTHAIDKLKELGGGKALIKRNMAHEDAYQALEKMGYSWNSDRGEWAKFEAKPNAPRSGVVDIRIRANTGDVERATKFIGDALQAAGFKFSRLSPPDPDDRNGPAITCRVYMQGILPD